MTLTANNAALILDDEYIEQCAAVFLEKNLYEQGILFWMFVKYPDDILAAVIDHDFKPMILKHSADECRQVFGRLATSA